MKKIIASLLCLMSFWMAYGQKVEPSTMDFKRQVSIGTGVDTFVAPSSSAWLQLPDSTTKGLLPARVADTSDISNPIDGLQCYQISDHTNYSYNGSLNKWVAIGGGANLANSDLTQTQATRSYTIPDGDWLHFLTGGTSGWEFTIGDADWINAFDFTPGEFNMYVTGLSGLSQVVGDGGSVRVSYTPNNGRTAMGLLIDQNGYKVTGNGPSTSGYIYKIDTAGKIIDPYYVAPFQDTVLSGFNASSELLTIPKTYFARPSDVAVTPINEGNGVGYIITGRDPNQYGNVGLGAVDLSFGSSPPSSTRGATGPHSFAAGGYTTASSDYSFAVGYLSTASGFASSSFGSSTTASGDYSSAFGDQSIASGDASSAFGSQSIASGLRSSAFGEGATASGAVSVAMGGHVNAFGILSSAFGSNTYSTAFACNVIGAYNDSLVTRQTVWTIGSPIFIVGNGVLGSTSNAYVLYNNGNSTQQGKDTSAGFVIKDGTPDQLLTADGGVSYLPVYDSASFSGDGSTTSFTVTISATVKPTAIYIQPTTADAAKAWLWVDASKTSTTSFTVTVSGTTPPSGTNNVKFYYQLIGSR